MKKLLSLMALFVVSMLTLSMVSALDISEVDFGTIKINGDEVNAGDVYAVEEGKVLNIRVGLEAGSGAEGIEVEAEISGYEYDDYENLEDSTSLFNIQAGTIKYKDLEVQMPTKLDKDEYMLRLRVMDKNSAALTQNILLSVEPARNALDIADVAFSPSNTVKAGRSLLATVLLENYGDRDQDDVKVTVAIPALGVSATEYVDEVVTDNHNVEREDVPEMFLPIPATATAGEYEVVVSAKYDNYETVTKTYTVNVLGNDMFQQQDTLVLAVGPESQNVMAGNVATYAVALTNAGTSSKAYLVEAAAGDWATVSLSESLVVLEPGKNKVVYVDVAVADDAVVGEHLSSLVIKSGNEQLETVMLKANVLENQNNDSMSLRNGLEIALIVLVVLLVVIGLIIGFSRLRKDDEEDEQTYY